MTRRKNQKSSVRRSAPVGVPSDYRELYSLFRPLLTAKASERGTTVSEVLSELRRQRVIEDFDIDRSIPDSFSMEEAARFLGLSDAEWKKVLKKTCLPLRYGTRTLPWACVRPKTHEDEYVQPSKLDVIYWGQSILAISDFLYDNDVPTARPESARIALAFRRRLGWFLSRIRVEAKPARVEPEVPLAEVVDKPVGEITKWPKELPRDEDELQKMYGGYIFDQVRRASIIKTDEELREVSQEVWLKLIEANVLGHFLEAARTKMPRTLTLEDVLGYLGITHGQWKNAMAYHRKNPSFYMPKPVKGTATGLESLFVTEQIQALDESGFLKGRRGEPRRHPEVTGRGFKSYLATCVQNHFKNLLRTRSRRHKERTIEPKMALAANESGIFQKVTTIEDASSWEENLTDDTGVDIPIEDLIDLADRFRQHGVDPVSDQGLEVMDLMTKGHTLRSAIKAQNRTLTRQKIVQVGVNA